MKHKRLSLEEREEIRLLLFQKVSYREIGRKINRNHSTILRGFPNQDDTTNVTMN
jgi:IS30 family transposase